MVGIEIVSGIASNNILVMVDNLKPSAQKCSIQHPCVFFASLLSTISAISIYF
jgi:hypothetical protein